MNQYLALSNMLKRLATCLEPVRWSLWLGLLAALGSAQAAESPPIQWQVVRPGVSYALQEAATAQADVMHRLHWIRIDLQQAELEVTLTPQNCAGLRLSDLDGDERIVASINASFFSPDFRTRGYTVSDSRPWTGVYRLTESPLLACAERQCQVLHQPPDEAPKDWRNVAGGVRSLVVDGVARTEQEDAQCGAFCETPHPRSALGMDASRRWLFWLAVEGRQKRVIGLPLNRLAARMQAAGVVDAVNFDGGGSTDLHVLGKAKAARPDDEPLPRRIANAWLLLGNGTVGHGKIASVCTASDRP
jgi:hypothetical protein